MSVVTIAFANVQSGVATTKGHWQYALTGWKYWLPHSLWPLRQAGDMLRREAVDLACLVEVSEKSWATGYHSQTEIVAERAGLPEKAFFGAPRSSIRPWEGKAILARWPIHGARTHLFKGGILPRYLAEATVAVDGKDISIFVAHLPLGRRARQRQIGEIVSVLKDRRGPVILAGDFNERRPGELAPLVRLTPLRHDLHVANYPSWKPRYVLDRIFLSAEFSVIDCQIPKGPAFSDHAPMLIHAQV